MNVTVWSMVLQWSRLGVNAALFLVAARFLDLAEIGAFAAAFAPIRLVQGMMRTGLGDAAVLHHGRGDALFALSAGAGGASAVVLSAAGLALPAPTGPMLAVLAIAPLLQGLSQPAEAHLRRNLRLRALALRTLAAQLAAAGLALWLLARGGGAWCLVAFALANTLISGVLSLWLAGIRPVALPVLADMRVLSRDALRLALRDLAGSATQPAFQMLIGLFLGLPAAGAFQIAARVLALVDTTAIAPLRYVALPRFSGLHDAALVHALAGSLRQTLGLAAVIYPLVWVSAPAWLPVAIGPGHAADVLPLLFPLCITGFLGAATMPLTQGLGAIGQVGLTLRRSLATLVLSLLLAVPGLGASVLLAVWAMPAASLLVSVWYVSAAMSLLRTTTRGAPAR